VRIGAESALPENPRTHYSRYINWRPADGETVHVNPPRVSWPYWPGWPNDWSDADHTFRLQISQSPDCSSPLVDVSTPLNFYNTLPELTGSRVWYWRVGYDPGTEAEAWSSTRSFAIADDAVVWDRASLVTPELAPQDHPRILLTPGRLSAIRGLADTHPGSRAALEGMEAYADEVLQEPWWRNFPASDGEPQPEEPFYKIAHDLTVVCFVWRITGDPKYAGVKDRAVTWASYPPGGRASPEGLGGDGSEDATQGNEFLALLFDWLYSDLTEEERGVMIHSLEWRVDHWMNAFAWRTRRRSGPVVRVVFHQGDRELGDPYHILDPSEEWQEISWEIEVPPETDRISLELHNYRRKGSAFWRGVTLRPRPGGPDLLGNPVSGWTFQHFDTGARRAEADSPGDVRTTVGVVCAGGSDRGAWTCDVGTPDADSLVVSGEYRTHRMGPPPVGATSLSGSCSSHQYEGSMDTAVCGLALYGHSPVGREWFDLILNYLIGVTCGHGFDEAWNEGAGYGTSKCKWLMNASLYFDTALPNANLGRNPFYGRIGDWFCRVIPVGMDHHAWGNQRNASRWNHRAHMRKFAYLTGQGRFLLNWQQYGGEHASRFRTWIEYVLPAYYRDPTPEPEGDYAALFPVGGWATAATGPPSLRSTYESGIGLVFQCRPRGGYSHSFNSDNSFQLHAYGQMLNHGGGSSANGDAFAYHTMSHNTVLVDGLGQAQTTRGQTRPAYGRIVAFSRGPQHVYVAGDATGCYPSEPGNYSRWSLPIHEVYRERALPHLKRFIRHVVFVRNRYFVIFDDLASSEPATYTWLYHILPDDPIAFDRERFRVDYRVGDVDVRLQHIARPAGLDLDDRQGLSGLTNPFTGEDYTERRKGDILCGHNLWVGNREPAENWSFLAVVYPAMQGGSLPDIRRIDDATVQVGDDAICFDPASPAASDATIVVDTEAIRP